MLAIVEQLSRRVIAENWINQKRFWKHFTDFEIFVTIHDFDLILNGFRENLDDLSEYELGHSSYRSSIQKIWMYIYL